MAKFIFKLQSFLGVKEKIEEQKKNEYGKALNILEEEKNKKQELLNRQVSTISHLKQKINEGIKPSEIKQYNNFISYIENEITRQEEVIIKAQKLVDRKREELVNAMKDKKILEILKENEYIEYIKEEKKAEQKFIDELVSFKYNK
jgi:flagellar FliJ protein